MMFKRSSLLRLHNAYKTLCKFKGSVCDDSECRKHVLSAKFMPTKHMPPAVYGGRHIVTMLSGVGIGPELMFHIRDIIAYINAPIDFEIIDDIRNCEDVENAITSIRRNGCAIKANIELTEKNLDEEHCSPNVAIRKKLDLYISLNVIKSYENVTSKHQKVDLIIIRQNTEGEYSMLEHEAKKGIVESMKICTTYNCERIANWAIRYAKHHNRKRITIVHKANIMKLSDGLFLHTIKKIGKKFPELKVDDIIIDNCCMQMVSDPHQFDVIVCPNIYGSILANVACGLIGGPGIMGSSNFGDNYATFEPAVRSTGRLLEGQNAANPVAMIMSMVNLLYYLGHKKYGNVIYAAVRKTIELDAVTTQDLGGKFSTEEVVHKIKENILPL